MSINLPFIKDAYLSPKTCEDYVTFHVEQLTQGRLGPTWMPVWSNVRNMATARKYRRAFLKAYPKVADINVRIRRETKTFEVVS